MKRAIILCSGGIDSVTCAHYVKKKLRYNKIEIVFFDYGQKSIEMEEKCSKKCAKEIGGMFTKVPLKWLGKISKSVINKGGKVEKMRREELKDTKNESRRFYVPCRNMVFITYATAIAESRFVDGEKWDLFVGFKNEGREPYPDTTREFVREINELNFKSTKGKIRIFAPLIKKDKEDIIRMGNSLGVDFKDTFSCYIGGGKQCGKCLACMLRKEGFYWSGIKDPSYYISP